MPDPAREPALPRRDFLRRGLAGALGAGVVGAGWLSARRAPAAETRWQIDPYQCIQCGQCMTHCVLGPSAVKCVHTFAICGYCKLCFGYFRPGASLLNTAAENQMCPTGALRRRYIEAPYYEYTIDRALCVGCGKCVKGCNTFGNGSLHLQIQHDLCVNCNDCAIARDCPADAIHRVPVSAPYQMKSEAPPKPK
jgi:Na+-translocating ferredoxin:NAD+ oxidoreductase subunit B